MSKPLLLASLLSHTFLFLCIPPSLWHPPFPPLTTYTRKPTWQLYMHSNR